MGLSGLIGAGANEGLEDILARQMLAQQQAEQMRARKAQEAMQQQQLGLATRRQDFDEQARQEDIEQSSIGDMRAQQAAADAKITRLQGEEDQMDAAAQLAQELAALMGDPNVADIDKRGLRLKKFGGGAPHMTADEQAAEDARKVGQVGAEAEARARAEAKFRPAAGGGAGFSLSEGQTRFDGSGNQIATVPKAASASGDPVSAARQVSEAASALLKHPGRPSAFGVIDARLPTFRQATRDAEILRDRVKAMLTMENMNKMKGVLSDSDMKILQQASTSLDGAMSDPAAVAELTRVQQIMDRVASSGVAPVSSHDGGSGLAVGTERVIKGRPAIWDGNGWVPK